MPIIDETFLSVPEAARELAVSPSTVWRWIDAGRLPAVRVGRRKIRVNRADLRSLVVTARHDDITSESTTSAGKRDDSSSEPDGRPSPAELARRQAAVARLLELSERISIAPLTTQELLDEVDRERLERYESWLGRG